jgi:hypothetical protein
VPTQYANQAQTATLVIARITGCAGWYTVRLGGELLGRSRSPFIDGARALLARGFPTHTNIEMRRADSDVISMRAVLGVAACLAVTDNRIGRPVFRRQKATESDAAPSAVRPSKLAHGSALDTAE